MPNEEIVFLIMPEKILITYCWNRVGYNILRSLAAKNIDIYVADTSKRNICSMSKFVKGCYVYPDPFTDENAFIGRLLEIVEQIKPRILLPTHDESLIIAKYRNLFPDSLIIPIVSYQLLKDLSDKQIATRLAESVGVPVPHIFLETSKITSFPVVFKAAISNSAKDVYFPKNKEELNSLMEQYKGKKTFVQEKLSGCDYSVDCVRGKDYFQASVYRALVTKTEGGGTTTQRIIVDKPVLCEYAKKILDKVDYLGVCGMDFKVDEETGRIGFIEINARYTGGLATPIAAGFDIPYIHYCLATHQYFEKSFNVKIGTKTKWLLGDVITFVGRLVSLKLTWKEFCQLLDFKFDAFDDFRMDDKRAILGEMSYYFEKLVKNGKLNP